MSRKAPRLLAALCAGFVLLACGLALLSPRPRGAHSALIDLTVPAAALAGSPRAASLPGLAPVPGSNRRESRIEARAGESSTPPAIETAATPIAGRLLLDGLPPAERGRILFRSEDGTRAGSVPVDDEGRFWLDAVPRAGLQLSFELPPGDQRLLLLPSLTVRPDPVQATELELDWRTKHVNLRVVGDASGWNRSRVHVAGPDHDADFETGDDGTARLSLVGTGLFTFRAVQASGRRGEATLALDEDTELESVVIRVGDPVDR